VSIEVEAIGNRFIDFEVDIALQENLLRFPNLFGLDSINPLDIEEC
jgi:hypothetical protein